MVGCQPWKQGQCVRPITFSYQPSPRRPDWLRNILIARRAGEWKPSAIRSSCGLIEICPLHQYDPAAASADHRVPQPETLLFTPYSKSPTKTQSTGIWTGIFGGVLVLNAVGAPGRLLYLSRSMVVPRALTQSTLPRSGPSNRSGQCRRHFAAVRTDPMGAR